MTPMTKLFYIACITGVCILAACGQAQQQQAPNGYAYIQLTPYESSPGCWGYEIYVDNKLYIRQDCIPVISGRQPFKSKQAAMDAGKIVFNKISSGRRPTLTAEDLKSIHVIP